MLRDVPIHTVTPQEAKHEVKRTSIIDGVRVVRLKDLIAIKLLCAMDNLRRSKDVADAIELIPRIPLDKRFASKLPGRLRATFKQLVDAVRTDEGTRGDRPRF